MTERGFYPASGSLFIFKFAVVFFSICGRKILFIDTMAQYYCFDCRILLGLLPPINSVSLTGTPYQLARYIKHTAPTGTYSVNSIFVDPTYITYSNYIVSGIVSGFLEIDYYGRNNLIWFAGELTGAEYHNGVFVAPTNGVKIVLPEDETKLHAFPILANPGTVNYCVSCRKPLPMW